MPFSFVFLLRVLFFCSLALDTSTPRRDSSRLCTAGNHVAARLRLLSSKTAHLRKEVQAAMYAVLRQGSHQYRVAPGDVIQIEKIDGEKGDVVKFDDVLLVQSEGGLSLGEPRVNGVSVTAKVIRQDKSAKVNIYKMRRRKGFSRRHGHRQPFTEVAITSIDKDGKALS